MTFDFSNPSVIFGIVAVALLIAAGIALFVWEHAQRKRTKALRSRFGAEYDLLVRDCHSRRRAEAKLMARIDRVEHMKIRDLDMIERQRYLEDWDAVQTRFVDYPRGAVIEADELVVSLLQARGFPVVSFEQRAADISVHHSRLVGAYRSATAITARAGRNDATTEELRIAMVHYHALFDELLHVDTPNEHKVLVGRPAVTRLGVQP